MMKILNILVVAFIGLTSFLIIVHLEKVEYLVNPKTGDTYIDLYDKGFKCSTYFKRDFENNLNVYLSFHHIESDFQLTEISIKLNDLEPKWIEPFHGMKPWDIPSYQDFVSIPDSLKILSRNSNPYFAYKHVFIIDNEIDKFDLSIEATTKEDGKILAEEIDIIKIKKIELRPWDPHSDITFLFIPLFGFVGVILLLIRLTISIKRKINSV